MTRMPAPGPGRPPDARRRHREMLVLACLVMVAAPLLQVRPDERVGLGAVPAAVLPPLCMTREWFGVRCPGCGLTRSFVHLAHGDLAASWQSHRLGGLLALAVVLQVPYRVASLRRPARPPLSPAVAGRIGYGLAGLLVVNWLVDVVMGL